MAKKTKRHDGGKEEFWNKAIQTRERGGLTIRAFCEREGLTESSYHFWRRQLIERGRTPSPGGGDAGPGRMEKRPRRGRRLRR